MYSVLDILLNYDYLGEQKLENGTLLIGRALHIAPTAWLHRIYAPLNYQELEELEKELDEIIPESYKEFLKKTNGLSVFNTTFSLDGLRKNYIRDLVNVWQPFDIITPNTFERPFNASKNMFFIGGYDWNGSLIYMDRTTNKIHVCDRDDATSLLQWPSFEEMLNSEIKRLVTLFDKDGRAYDGDKSTLPYLV